MDEIKRSHPGKLIGDNRIIDLDKVIKKILDFFH
jgi:hypothetical protein